MDDIEKEDYEMVNSFDDEDQTNLFQHRNGGSESDDEEADICSATTKKTKRKKKRKAIDIDAKGNPKLSAKKIKELQEAEILGQSNLYRFQIDELLKEIEVKSKVRVKIHEWLGEFKELLNNLKGTKSYPLSSYKKLLGDLPLPFPTHIHPKRAHKSTFQWTPPENIGQVGSWNIETAVGKISAFDVAVEMPSDLFHKTDILNHVYHFKRAMYVGYVAKTLKNSGDDIKFSYDKGDPLKPILSIFIKNKKPLYVQVHFVLPPSFDKFPKARLGPLRNNIRANYFLGRVIEGETGHPTPSYNQTILQDILYFSSRHILDSISKSPSICNAIKILKVWLTQRCLNEGFGSFSGFILTMFVAYLGTAKKIHSNMSAYQIVRFVLLNLFQSDWCTAGITFEPVEKDILADWHSVHDVVFLDSTGHLNFATNMSRFTFKRVQYEAQLALNQLNSSTTSGFQSIFIAKAPFFLNFDNILQLTVTPELMERFQTDPNFASHYLNFSGYHVPLMSHIIGPLIQRCLGQRLKFLDLELASTARWDTTESRQNTSHLFRFGLTINRDSAFKIVEKCESEDPAATQMFKAFWGDKSELRRFMDGTMTESVTFDDPEIPDRIPFQMVKYILYRHLNITIRADSDDYLDAQLERLLEPKFSKMKFFELSPSKQKGHRFHTSRPQPELCQLKMDQVTCLAMKSFDGVRKCLRQLQGLPLTITSVQGTSPVLRFTSILPPPPQRFVVSKMLTERSGGLLKLRVAEDGMIPKVPKNVEPIDMVVELESSGNWPEDLEAIERLKCAFLIRIGQLLQQQFNITVQFFPQHLFLLKDGFIFRVRLTYYRELILLKQLRGPDGILRIRDNPQSLILERESLILPQLTTTLNSIHRQFGSFGHTCSLAKRWMSSHLLLSNPVDPMTTHRHPDTRFTQESIELLVASLYFHPSPFLSHPNEGQLGLLRFLNLIGNTDWKVTPVLLNFNGKLNSREIEEIEVEFVKRRESVPLVFISTPEDRVGSVWTKYLSEAIVRRAGVLAKFGIDTLLMELGENGVVVDKDELFKWKRLFTPSTKVFDGIIYLKKGFIGKKAHFSSQTFTEYTESPHEVIPIVDFDPVRQYFHELSQTFGHLSNFVSDVCGGALIAFAWKQEGMKRRHFEISQVRGRKLDGDGKSLVVDVDSVLEEMEVMGHGIVDRIELKNGTHTN